MNRARALYEGDASVEFLFINTWQDEADKKTVAQKFITTNNYPFHVLLDVDDAVVAAYKVRGIPTKFVVDKNGRIRFTKIGFDGNDDRTVKELQLMIEMVK
jgi:peroxiredoxin